MLIGESLESSENDIEILVSIYRFIELWKKRRNTLSTFVVIFKLPRTLSEKNFENLLWSRLQRLHELDKEIYPWDTHVSSEIYDAHFSFSLGAQGFFIVGLHSKSSRKSRRFIYPTLIFNLHAQFERLKDNGKFNPMRSKIRERDIIYSGSLNPMVKDFGENSEALQYSGRETKGHNSLVFNKTNPKYPWEEIKPCSGTSFILNKGDLLIVKDVQGQQVADLFCVASHDTNEFLYSGKSIYYNDKIFFSTGDILYSNKNNPMLRIINDDVKKHDFLFAPCSKETLKAYGHSMNRKGCYEHLIEAFLPYNISSLPIPTTFNIFMNVSITSKGNTRVKAPLSKAGDKIIFQNQMDLIVGLTACSSPKSNNYSFKPISFKVLKSDCRERK